MRPFESTSILSDAIIVFIRWAIVIMVAALNSVEIS